MHTTPRAGLVLLTLVAAVVAACSGSAATASPPTAPPPTQSPAASPTESPEATASPATESPTSTAPAAGVETVAIADSGLGQILVDGDGRTLYLFQADADGEPTCYDQCEDNWPPLVAEGEIAVGAGLDDSDFSTVARTDGTMQVRIGDWPLYYFAADAAPGDTNGQGVGDVWFVVSPTGEAIQ